MNTQKKNRRKNSQKKNVPLLPVSITFAHMKRDLLDAQKAHRMFMTMGECMWASDYERLCRQISSKITEYIDLQRRYQKQCDEKYLKWTENLLREYEHRPFKKPQNLSYVVSKDGVDVRLQQKDYHRPAEFQGVTC